MGSNGVANHVHPRSKLITDAIAAAMGNGEITQRGVITEQHEALGFVHRTK